MSSLAHAIRLPSLLWSAVFGFWVAIVVANATERLSSRLAEPASAILEISIILSVTITVANVLSTLMRRVSERQALGGPIAGLGQSIVRGVVYCVGLLVHAPERRGHHSEQARGRIDHHELRLAGAAALSAPRSGFRA